MLIPVLLVDVARLDPDSGTSTLLTFRNAEAAQQVLQLLQANARWMEPATTSDQLVLQRRPVVVNAGTVAEAKDTGYSVDEEQLAQSWEDTQQKTRVVTAKRRKRATGKRGKK